MKFGIILFSEDQKSQAGVRIRYDRIKLALQHLGHSLEFIPIQNLGLVSDLAYDICLISKCYDSRAIMAAELLQSQGVNVGVDLFDDYFSQVSDSRFLRLRYWLKNILPYCSFVLCSTLAMRSIAKIYAPNLPVHILNDPAQLFDPKMLAMNLARKLDFAQRQRRIDIAWFGMGDNPNFPVGITDLSTLGCEIDRLRGYNFDINLNILTNRRALTTHNLSQLRKLATSYEIEEWTEEREVILLEQSLVSFLPVNAQSFSRVKSLNRAVTALTAGTQVLSSGYPLYQSLDQFIYRCPRKFITDLKMGKLAFRAATVLPFSEKMRQLADVDVEANALNKFISSLNPPKHFKNKILALIHGKETLVANHKFAQKNKILSVKSLFCHLEVNFDVRFRQNNQAKLEILISKKKVSLIDQQLMPYLNHSIKLIDTEYFILELFKFFPDIPVIGLSLINLNTPATNAAAYHAIMEYIIEVLQRIFPNVECVVSEHSKRIPWTLPKIAEPKVIS